ncbi:MAG: tRNA (adenosine(37)-N6)-threonylcarbamoyltransferase complex dimerization subunit type 1 TsaB [Clostridia bacterium]|nr:tRNA (adenosine(37)-N6)-threonylcarbamoyltransferase complex dimerization subunit type 1 TsaB [Clostridia bacterium]
MNRLLINTANDELFIVLQKDNEIFSKSINSKMHHNETMLPEIDNLLRKHNVEINDMQEFGVVIGPGSFTGIRVGISTIKAFRDALNVKAKSINNLDYLFKLAKKKDPKIETVAINGSRDSYFVAKLIHGVVYKYERNLTLKELVEVSKNKLIGMFKEDENLNCLVVEQNAEILLECLKNSADETLVPVYYQLSQAENEKLKRAEVKIRKAAKKDLKEIVTLEKQNVLVNTINEQQIKTALEDKNYEIFKAQVEDEIVGFVMLQMSDELNIESIAVKKEYRNLGIATKLIEKARECAKENNVPTLSLEVGYKNITAYLLYKKLGFVERRIRKNYYADGTDCIEMIKRILT